jgi:hypothetical protein
VGRDKESAIDILAELVDVTESSEVADSLLHAIYYLRSGGYPFNRKGSIWNAVK